MIRARQPANEVDIAEWTARGLSAYDASSVAPARSRDVKLTADEMRVLKVAGNIAVALSGIIESKSR